MGAHWMAWGSSFLIPPLSSQLFLGWFYRRFPWMPDLTSSNLRLVGTGQVRRQSRQEENKGQRHTGQRKDGDKGHDISQSNWNQIVCVSQGHSSIGRDRLWDKPSLYQTCPIWYHRRHLLAEAKDIVNCTFWALEKSPERHSGKRSVCNCVPYCQTKGRAGGGNGDGGSLK